MPKYFEYHFRRSTSSSGSAGGMSKALGSVVGILVSGAVLARYCTVLYCTGERRRAGQVQVPVPRGGRLECADWRGGRPVLRGHVLRGLPQAADSGGGGGAGGVSAVLPLLRDRT